MISAIIYNSKTGSCEKYAQLIANGLTLPPKKMGSPVRHDGQIVYVGWTFAGSIVGLKKAMQKYNVAAAVQVGMGAVSEKSADFVRQKNGLPETVKVFCRQGGFHMDKLPLPFRLIMKVKNKQIAAGLEKKGQLNEQEQALLNMAKTGSGEPASWDVSDIVDWAKHNLY